jgi:hypothetical protein
VHDNAGWNLKTLAHSQKLQVPPFTLPCSGGVSRMLRTVVPKKGALAFEATNGYYM